MRIAVYLKINFFLNLKFSIIFIKGHTGEVNSVECSHKIPNLLLSAGNDRSVKLWDLEKGVVV